MLAMAVKMKSLEHYAALALAVGCGILAYQYDNPLRPTLDNADAPIHVQPPAPTLRSRTKAP